MKPEFRVVFWNIWMDAQLEAGRLAALKARLGRLVDELAPDVIGLNEVVVDRATGRSVVLDFLASLGYETHFTMHSPDQRNTLMGVGLATRRRWARLDEPVLGPDTSARRRGEVGQHLVRAIDADVPAGDGVVRVVVNYWAHLVPYNWRTHAEHARTLRGLVTGAAQRPRTILGGDFNELKHMPAIRGLAREYHRATGTFWRPTWRWNGRAALLVRANYDHLLWSRDESLELAEFRVLGAAPSDHSPLFGRFLV